MDGLLLLLEGLQRGACVSAAEVVRISKWDD